MALSWIPLSRIGEDLPGIKDFHPVSIYRNKGLCVSAFNKLVEAEGVSQKSKGDIRELVHSGVISAIGLLSDMAGERLLITGALLGHRRAESTMRYSHLNDSFLLRAADKVGKTIHAWMSAPS